MNSFSQEQDVLTDVFIAAGARAVSYTHLRRQGRRLRQQDLPLPGNEGPAESGHAEEVPGGEDEHAGLSLIHI